MLMYISTNSDKILHISMGVVDVSYTGGMSFALPVSVPSDPHTFSAVTTVEFVSNMLGHVFSSCFQMHHE